MSRTGHRCGDVLAQGERAAGFLTEVNPVKNGLDFIAPLAEKFGETTGNALFREKAAQKALCCGDGSLWGIRK